MALILPWVALSWFMWAWKTAVWEALSREIIPSKLVDVDKVIREDLIRMPIWDFIWKYSMPEFRKIESQAIAEILWQDFDNTFQIISLWWWAITIQQNVDTIKAASFKLVYLDVPFDIIVERLKVDAEWNENRVPFDEDKFRELYNGRQDTYRSTADLVVSNIWRVENVVDEILWKL